MFTQSNKRFHRQPSRFYCFLVLSFLERESRCAAAFPALFALCLSQVLWRDHAVGFLQCDQDGILTVGELCLYDFKNISDKSFQYCTVT